MVNINVNKQLYTMICPAPELALVNRSINVTILIIRFSQT